MTTLWPAIGVTVNDHNGDPITTSGISVGSYTEYYRDLVSAGSLLTYDPLDLGGAAVAVADGIGISRLANGTPGNLISYGASGAPVAVATGTAAQVLVSNGAGLPPTFQSSAGTVTNLPISSFAAGTAGNLLSYDAGGLPVAVATGTATHVLTSNGAGLPPTFQSNASTITGATSATTTIQDAELVAGGFFYHGLGTVTLQAQVELTTTDAAGYARILLYDMGAGTGAFSPVLRSTVQAGFANAGQVILLSQALTKTGSPGVDADQIINTERAYEIRLLLHTSDAATVRLVWAGLKVT